MHIGLVISVLMHAAILGWSIVSFQSQRELRAPELEAIAVGMVSPAEITKVKLGDRNAKEAQTDAKATPKEAEPARKEAVKARPVAAAPPPPAPEPEAEKKLDPIAEKLAEPRPTPQPAPAAPAPDEQQKLAAEKAKAEAEALRRAEEQREAEAKQKAEEKRRAEEKKAADRRKAELQRKAAERKRRLEKKRTDERKRQQAEAAKSKEFDADRIAALLNKVPNKSAPPPSATPDRPTKAKGPALGDREGRDKEISAGEKAMLNAILSSRLKICWRLPSAGGGSDTPVVTLRWHLKPDGSLDGDPVVIESTRNDALFRIAAEAAIRAVRECSPFPLPPDKYGAWKTIIRDFDPKHML